MTTVFKDAAARRSNARVIAAARRSAACTDERVRAICRENYQYGFAHFVLVVRTRYNIAVNRDFARDVYENTLRIMRRA